ncbi:hypothetical protein ACE6H2_013950 [Prunus campanulata]
MINDRKLNSLLKKLGISHNVGLTAQLVFDMSTQRSTNSAVLEQLVFFVF